MIGCHIGRNFQVTVAGGSYQDGLTAMVQGHAPGMLLTEQEIYGDLLLRKPGADELSSPRKEPDLPIIYTGLNAADTVEGAGNKNHTNGTPLTIGHNVGGNAMRFSTDGTFRFRPNFEWKGKLPRSYQRLYKALAFPYNIAHGYAG